MKYFEAVGSWYKKLLGGARYCFVCDKKFTGRFLPLHSMYTEQLEKAGYKHSLVDAETLNFEEYTCPYCQCTDRDRIFAWYVKTRLKYDFIYKFLDIAPNPALNRFLKNRTNIDYRSADLIDQTVDDKFVDITNMVMYNNCSFDIILCSHVLEHVGDDIKALSELFRVLKIGGFAILMVPIVMTLTETDEDPTIVDEAVRWRRFGQGDHVRLYSKRGFMDRVVGAGFRLTEIRMNMVDRLDLLRCGISQKSVLYIAEKL